MYLSYFRHSGLPMLFRRATECGSAESDLLKMNFLESSSSATTKSPTYVQPFDNAAIIISASILLPLSLFGVIANVTTIVVIARSTKLKTIFNYFIISLSISDLISALISPLLLYRRTWGFDDWVISSFMCKFYWATDLWTSYVTSVHILLFALLRYVSIKSPSQYYRIKKQQVKITIAAVWIVTFIIGFIPFAIMFTSKARDRNSDSVDAKWPACTLDVQWLSEFMLYCMAAYSLLFYIPIIFVVIISIAIVIVIYNKRRKRQSIISSTRGVARTDKSIPLESKRQIKERQIILQLCLIVGSFLLGYIPHTVYHFYTTSSKPNTFHAKVFDWWFGMIEHICLRISECLNPIFYNLASSNMRKETFKLIRTTCGLCKKCCPEPDELNVSTNRNISIPMSAPTPDKPDV